MLCQFRLRAPDGHIIDVAVEYERHTTVGALSDELRSHVLQRCGPVTRNDPEPGDVPWAIQVTQRLHPSLHRETLVVNAGIRRGDLVEFIWSAAVQSLPGPEVPFTVAVLDGPDAGATFPLVAGLHIIGRGPDSSVRLTDPGVSRRQCTLSVGSTLELVIDGSVGDISIDGSPVEATSALMPGARLGMGGTVLGITAGDSRATPHEDVLALNRPPHLMASFEPRSFSFPSPPDVPRRFRFPWITLLAGVMMSGLFVVLDNGQLRSGIFYLMMPILLVAGSIESRLAGTAEHRERRRHWMQSVVSNVNEVAAAENVERHVAEHRHPHVRETLATVDILGARVWERQPTEADFLSLRVGTATLPTAHRIEIEAGGPADLQAQLHQQVDAVRHVEGLPLALGLGRCGHLGIAGSDDAVRGVTRSLLAQIVGMHSPAEVAIAALLSTSDPWEWMKWLPHVRTAAVVLSAPCIGIGASVIETLLGIETLVRRRSQQTDTHEPIAESARLPRLVVLYDSHLDLDRARLDELLRDGPASGVHVLWLDDDFARLPARAGGSIAIRQDGIRADVGVIDTGQTFSVDIEPISMLSTERLSLRMAPISDASRRLIGDAALPSSISLPELLQAPGVLSDVELLVQRWNEDRKDSLDAVIGLRSDGQPLMVDLRHDGPHALVAGTTGAGKSEFLQTLVASLALNHSPAHVNFLLVDYKGGAAFRDCALLPHTVGVVTDLDSHQVSRVLVSLEAELRRREVTLAAAGAKDLMEMQLHSAADAPPSLVVIIDEFAALVHEIPEFIDGVVNIAQRGRSLGLHLVLATQRPAGVISDSIRANTNLRIALRTADAQESVDVIGSPLAGQISRSTPGRGVARVGASELFTFQAAFVGGVTPNALGSGVRVGRFDLANPVPPPINVDLTMIRNTPRTTDLRRVVASATMAATQLGIGDPFRPWIDPLPDVVDLDQLGHAPRGLMIPIALVDLPEHQMQITAWLDFERDGHVLVLGAPGSGKTVVLRSIAGALARRASSEPVWLYAIDAAGGALAGLERLPNVGSVLVSERDVEQVVRLLRHLCRELEQRSEQFATADIENMAAARRNPAGAAMPCYVLLIDGLPAFYEQFDRIEHGSALTMLQQLVTNGPRVGIHLVVSTDRSSGMFTVLTRTVRRRILLRQMGTEEFDPINPQITLPSDAPRGRAIIDGHHAQIGIINGDPTPAAQQQELSAQSVPAKRPVGAPPVPTLPRHLHPRSLPTPISPDRLPIAIADLGLSPASVNLVDDHFSVFGPPQSGKSSTLWLLAHQIAICDPLRELVLIVARPELHREPGPWSQVLVGPASAIDFLESARITSTSRLLVPPMTIAIDDLTDMIGDGLDAPLLQALDRSLAVPIRVIATGDSTRSATWADSLRRLRSNRTGLLLMPHLDKDGDLLGANLPSSMLSHMSPGRGFLVGRSGRPALVQVATLDPHS